MSELRKSVIPFFEGNFDRVLRLFAAGLAVRSPSLLKPKFHNNPFCRKKAPLPPSYGFVYVFPSGPFFKIGITASDVKGRWSSIKTGNPLLEPPAYVSPPVGKLARAIELSAHKILAEYHESGEWFRCSRELAIQAVRKAIEEHSRG